ncbi:MAG: sporulation protein YunB [Clostridia bacterium]|nr:sporulation protein YunB [Clostridia bacterium]
MRKATKCLWWVIVFVIIVSIWLVVAVNPVVFNYAHATLDAVAVQAVNKGVADVVNADTFSNLTDIRRDANGTITSINADAVAMNLLAVQVSNRAQEYLNVMSNEGLPVPIGTFSGIPFLVGQGFMVKLNLRLIGAVNCNFNSEFKTAGINQTEHKITLRTHAVVDIVLPFYTKRTDVVVEMLFSDSIIVGEVPEFLLAHKMN